MQPALPISQIMNASYEQQRLPYGNLQMSRANVVEDIGIVPYCLVRLFSLQLVSRSRSPEHFLHFEMQGLRI